MHAHRRIDHARPVCRASRLDQVRAKSFYASSPSRWTSGGSFASLGVRRASTGPMITRSILRSINRDPPTRSEAPAIEGACGRCPARAARVPARRRCRPPAFGSRGLIIRLEQRGVAVRDNRSTGHVLALLDAIAVNVATLRRVLVAREVKMDK
jgi:hypothetical protein